MGQDGFEMVFGLAGALPVAAGRLAARGEMAGVGAAAAALRLFVRLGEPRPAPLGEIEILVTLGVPLAALALAAIGNGFVAGTPLTVRWMDDRGSCNDLPASHLTVVLRTLPRAATFARFQTLVHIPDTARRLRVSVLHTASGLRTCGEAACAPPFACGAWPGALAPRLVAH
jgi:hypothetical protein